MAVKKHPKRKAASKRECPRPGSCEVAAADRHAAPQTGARRATAETGGQAAKGRPQGQTGAPPHPAGTTPGKAAASGAARQGARRRPRSPATAASCQTTSGWGKRHSRDDRLISSARAGHDELRTRLNQHTETSPALTGGDIDAKWQDAYAVGDEAPGGDNPTPGSGPRR